MEPPVKIELINNRQFSMLIITLCVKLLKKINAAYIVDTNLQVRRIRWKSDQVYILIDIKDCRILVVKV